MSVPVAGAKRPEEGGSKSVEVYNCEGDGRLVSVSPPPGSDQSPMSQYLTSKLVADSLTWQQTFRNDSPSQEEPRPGTSLQITSSLPDPASDPVAAMATRAKVSAVLDPGVINQIEKEARKLAADVAADGVQQVAAAAACRHVLATVTLTSGATWDTDTGLGSSSVESIVSILLSQVSICRLPPVVNRNS